MQTITNPFIRLMTRLTFSAKVNRLVPYPLRHFTFPSLLSIHFTDNRPLCFIFFGLNSFLFQSPYYDYLRKQYPHAKYILYLQDIIARNTQLDMSLAKKQFDCILSYDKGDCQQYDLIYHPTPYSSFDIPKEESVQKSDVFFCGKGKDRYPLIHSIYEQCIQKGLQCDFHITDMPKSAKRINGICYNKPLTYIDNLKHITRTKCILEIMQFGADGFTPRLWEALFYNKHLLTNNHTIVRSPYYDKKQTHIIDNDLSDITEWIDTEVASITPSMQDNLSPVQLIRHIESIIEQ